MGCVKETWWDAVKQSMTNVDLSQEFTQTRNKQRREISHLSYRFDCCSSFHLWFTKKKLLLKELCVHVCFYLWHPCTDTAM